MMSKLNQFIGHVLPGVVRPLRVLWNEIIGFIFIVLAAWAAPSAFRHLRDYNGNAETLFRAGLSLIFAGLMIYFGISSFLRARKISRS
jgi:hypothetical protein